MKPNGEFRREQHLAQTGLRFRQHEQAAGNLAASTRSSWWKRKTGPRLMFFIFILRPVEVCCGESRRKNERERGRKKKTLRFYFSWLRRGFHLSPFGAAPPCFLSGEAWMFSQPCVREKKSFNFMWSICAGERRVWVASVSERDCGCVEGDEKKGWNTEWKKRGIFLKPICDYTVCVCLCAKGTRPGQLPQDVGRRSRNSPNSRAPLSDSLLQHSQSK